jgi:DNA-binding CsgD family transcriptional regulator
MPQIDVDQLARIVVQIPNYSDLTPAERTEVTRLAQGYQCKDSAGAANVSPETIRARRKRIYHKLEVPGAAELISTLLACSLRMLAGRTRSETEGTAVVTPAGGAAADASGDRPL